MTAPTNGSGGGERPPVPSPAGFLSFWYENYRGEVSERTIIPMRIYHGATEWHPEPQWLLEGWDMEKDAVRAFAMSDMQAPPAQVGAATDSVEGVQRLAAIRDGAGLDDVYGREWCFDRAAQFRADLAAALASPTKPVADSVEAVEQVDALDLARMFHEAYERLAPMFGYETREDTKAFDPSTSNGRLMIATASKVLASMPSTDQEGLVWQSIETAPEVKGKYFFCRLAWGPEDDQSTGDGFRWNGRWFVGAGFYKHARFDECQHEIRQIEVSPTHWMPLPAVPLTRARQMGSEGA